MPDQVPGIEAIVQTEEVQLFGAGPNNEQQQIDTKAHLKSTVVDSGNSPTSTLRGGFLLARKDSDGLDYKYAPGANDGTQCPIGIVPKHMTMLDRYGTAVDKLKSIKKGGLIQNVTDLINYDLAALAVLLRTGFHLMQALPHGSAFLYHPVRRDFKTADYTVTSDDHGKMLVAATNAVNFTLPSLATVGVGFEVHLFNSANAIMVVTGAADTIVYDDTANGKSTTLTWSTANQKMGASVLMRADYDVDGTTLSWYPLQIQRTVTAA